MTNVRQTYDKLMISAMYKESYEELVDS